MNYAMFLSVHIETGYGQGDVAGFETGHRLLQRTYTVSYDDRHFAFAFKNAVSRRLVVPRSFFVGPLDLETRSLRSQLTSALTSLKLQSSTDRKLTDIFI